MSRLLLLSELHPALDAFVAGAGLVGVLPDAGDLVGEPEIAERARQHLRRAGAHVVDLDLDGDVPVQLERLDVLVVTGGAPDVLGARLRRTGGGAAIVAAVASGALAYAGISAGAMVAGPSLAPHLDVDPEDLPPGPALAGLGLTELHVLPHDGQPGREGLHRRARDRHGAALELAPLGDADALLVVDGVARRAG